MVQTSFLYPSVYGMREEECKTYKVSRQQILSCPTLCREGPSVTFRGGEGDRIGRREDRKSCARLKDKMAGTWVQADAFTH